ncbi:MAG: hypothetical protein AB1757_06205 [Acidobacteriota bacterium]
MCRYSLVCLLCLCIAFLSCQTKITPKYVSSNDLEKIINEKAPLGTSVSDVRKFIDSWEVNSIKATLLRYTEGNPNQLITPDDSNLIVSSYMEVSFPQIYREEHFLYATSFSLYILFYFDKSGHLIDHKINMIGVEI